MIDMGLREGSKEWAVTLTVAKDTVYLHTDIEQVKDEYGNLIDNLYGYHEIQYTLEEYNKMSKAKKDKLKNGIAV